MNLFEDLKKAIETKNFDLDGYDIIFFNLEKEIPDVIEMDLDYTSEFDYDFEGDMYVYSNVERVNFVEIVDSEIYTNDDLDFTDEQIQELTDLLDFKCD